MHYAGSKSLLSAWAARMAVRGAASGLRTSRTVFEQEGQNMLELHQDHIAEKRDNSLCHYACGHTAIPITNAMRILDAQAAVVKELDKLKKLPAWCALTVVEKEGRNSRSPSSENPSPFRYINGTLPHEAFRIWRHIKNNNKGRVVLRGDESGCKAVFTEQGPSALN